MFLIGGIPEVPRKFATIATYALPKTSPLAAGNI